MNPEAHPSVHDDGLPARIVSRIRRDVPLATLDAVLVVPAYLIPLALRFRGTIPAENWDRFWLLIPLVIAVHLACNYAFGLYGQMWRYASVQEARRIVASSLVAFGVLCVAMIAMDMRQRPIPLSVIAFGSLTALMAFGAVRFQSRLFGLRRRLPEANRTRVLLMGVGDAGAQVLNDVARDPQSGLQVVGLLDDDPRLQGRSIHGVKVIGTREAIPRAVRDLDADQVLLAIPTATSEVIREVATLCEEAGVSLRVLPSVREIVGGRVTARDLRDLRIEDLLGRQQVQTDLGAVRSLIRGKRVLITGAGGSIGSEIARQVSRFEPAHLALLDNDETHLHELLLTMDGSRATAVLADIRDRGRIVDVFVEQQPQLVFHAAAHKHVPILEEHPQEALMTNVLGTANVVEAAAVIGVERFVMISTDKAVRPTSVMGGSKRLAEEIVRGLAGRDTVYCAVRFGNVLGSRGSVVPTFLRQIAAGGPVTVTDPAMTRYFMSVEEAVQLVLQAATLASGGEVFTLEMGEPVNILELARNLIRLSGRVPGRDVAVQVVGARPGEKRHEELVDDDEAPVPTGYPGIVVATPPPPDPAALRRRLREMEACARDGRQAELAACIRHASERVPEPVGGAS
ncbi:MAG TPA: nucleoside-diphosphate sugar epimerase/dehydratase [Actinomycetota bacterium]